MSHTTGQFRVTVCGDGGLRTVFIEYGVCSTGQFRVTLFAETVVWRQSSSNVEFADEVIHVHSKVDVQLEWRTMYEAERLRT